MVVGGLLLWCNDLGSGRKSGGEDIESVFVYVECAIERKGKDRKGKKWTCFLNLRKDIHYEYRDIFIRTAKRRSN